MVFYRQLNNNKTPEHLVNTSKKDIRNVGLLIKMFSYTLYIEMATKILDPDYSAEKRNNISEINLSLKYAFGVIVGFVNGTLLCLLDDY